MKETTLFTKKLHLGWQPKFQFKKGRTHTILKISFFLFLQAIFCPSVSAQTVEVWWSAGFRSNSTYPLEQQNDLVFEDPDNSSVDQVIAIDHDERYQQMLGHGISMEHSTIYNLNRMSPEAKEEALRALFDPVEGLGIDWVRLCLGASDFTGWDWHSYDEMPPGEKDLTLEHFSIQNEYEFQTIQTLQQCLQINPKILFHASPWSPPGWMKTTGSMLGGQLLPEHNDEAALYYAKTIQAYKEAGIPIYAMTVQNETGVSKPAMPSCIIQWPQHRDLAILIAEEFAKLNLDTKIWILDHNFDMAMNYAAEILDDPAAYEVVEGTAFHSYRGEVSAMTELHNAYPEKAIHFTERSCHGASGMEDVAEFYRNWAQDYSSWVTMLDTRNEPNPGPHGAGNTMLKQDANNWDEFTKWGDYYMQGAYIKFMKRGAYRIGCDKGSRNTVTAISFLNPDATIATMVINQSNSSKSFRINWNGKMLKGTIQGGAIGTHVWPSGLEPQSVEGQRSLLPLR